MAELPGQQTMEGMEANTKVSITGTTFKTHEDFELGEDVKLRISGHVVLTGQELIEKEGDRAIVKIVADEIEVL